MGDMSNDMSMFVSITPVRKNLENTAFDDVIHVSLQRVIMNQFLRHFILKTSVEFTGSLTWHGRSLPIQGEDRWGCDQLLDTGIEVEQSKWAEYSLGGQHQHGGRRGQGLLIGFERGESRERDDQMEKHCSLHDEQ